MEIPNDAKMVLSLSGGKDSTAMILHFIEKEIPFIPVFADTGNENEITLEYLDYLEQKLGIAIKRVKADFSNLIMKKREFIQNDKRDPSLPGRLGGWSDEAKERALKHLYPTGETFLDMCLWKGFFPATRSRFCTQHLKREVIFEEIEPLLEQGKTVVNCVGVRAEESRARSKYTDFEYDRVYSKNLIIYRPILHWSVGDVFKMHLRHGLEPNPLYKMGFGRVGCMPCINSRKDEIFEISRVFPSHIEKIKVWEKKVRSCSKKEVSTFFAIGKTGQNRISLIKDVVEWSRTVRGGQQYDLLKTLPVPTCKSLYGLCE